jgi:hypothetical protein
VRRRESIQILPNYPALGGIFGIMNADLKKASRRSVNIRLVILIALVAIFAVEGFYIRKIFFQEKPEQPIAHRSDIKIPAPVPVSEISETKAAVQVEPKGISGSGRYMNEEYGFEMIFPEGWSFYEWKDTDDSDSVILNFVPVPEDWAWGDSFMGSVIVHEDIDDFSEWFSSEAEFGAARTQRMLKAAASQKYPVTEENFISEYRETSIDGAPAIIQITELVKCPFKNTPARTCVFLGGSLPYEEGWFIYSEGSIIEIHIQTYLTDSAKKGYANIISTFKFTK